jgi:hypothetical protein
MVGMGADRMAGQRSATRTELEQQFDWFDREARKHGYAWRGIKIFNAVAAGVASGTLLLTTLPAQIPAALAALVAVLEVIDYTTHPRDTNLRYRDTAEQLRDERTLYDAHAEPYADAQTADAVLAGRLAMIRARERGVWNKEWGRQPDAKA